YGKYDGQPFPLPDDLFPRPEVVQFILQYGEDGLDVLNHAEGDAEELVEQMIEAGLMERDAQTGQLRLTPRMLRGIEHRVLLEIFEGLKRGPKEGHETPEQGRSG